MSVQTVDKPKAPDAPEAPERAVEHGSVARQPSAVATRPDDRAAAKMPVVATRQRSRVFLRWTVGSFLLVSAAVFAFAWYVNPWGGFGPVGFHRLYNARLAKAEYLSALPSHELPPVFVLGSSNTMSYSPATIEAQLGKKAFNYGVFWGRAEDALCTVRYLLEDLNHRPELLIVGADTWMLAPSASEHPVFPSVRRRLLNTPQLVRHHPDVNPVALYWSKFIDAFSRQHLELCWKLLHDERCHRARQAPLVESGKFAADGSRTWFGGLFSTGSNFYEEVETGNARITQEVRRITAAGNGASLGVDFYDFDEFSPQRMAYMEQLVERCAAEGIEIVFVINPVHPDFLTLLNERTPHPENLQKLRAVLARFERENAVVLGTVDASDILALGGDLDGFFDAMHPASRNCDLAIERVAALIRNR